MADTLTYTRHGNEWLFADGTRLPVVSGGDGDDSGAATTTTEPAPAAPADAEPGADAPADDGDGHWTDTVDRTGWDERTQKNFEKLRRENASYRTRANELGQHFDGLHADDASALLSLVDAVKSDPGQAAALMRQFAEVLTPAEQAEVRGAAAEAAGVAATDAPLTRAEFDSLMAEREQAQGIAEATRELQREATDLGYEPESKEYFLLLQIANAETGGDLKKADESIKAWKQSFIDDFVSGKRNDANSSPLVPTPGAPATQDHTPKTFAEAKAAADEFLKNLG